VRITHVDAWEVRVPCRDGVLAREGRWFDPENPLDAEPHLFDALTKWIIRVHADNGRHGLGESSRGESAASVEAGIAALVGRDPCELAPQRLPLPAGADHAMFETALLDLLGRTWDVPVHQLLGGAVRDHVEIDSWSSRKDAEATAVIAADARTQGFRGIKLKAALGEPGTGVDEDDPLVDRVAAVAAACGDGFGITIDPNFRFFTLERTLALTGALEAYPVAVLEDPFPWSEDDVSAYAELRRRTSIPVAMHVNTATAMVEAIAGGAADAFNIGASPTAFVRMAWIAEQAGIPCWCGSGVDLGIRDMAAIHGCFASAACTLPSDLIGNRLREDDLIREPIPIVDGHVPRSDAPGLGVELDEDAVERYAVRDKRAAAHLAPAGHARAGV
jgi:muconate cycloisomerase